jgi:4-hydroxyacetophenone monooxygenase
MTAYTREQLGDREDLIDRVTPSHAPMARRLIVDNGWYRTLREDHVELVTAPIERMTSRGIRTTDEVDHEVDLVIAATGFATTKFLFPMRYTGLGGRTLEDAWAVDGPRAHLGMTVPGFPSLFIMYGPSAQPRSGSTISLIEQWVSYAVQAIVLTIEQGARRIDVRQEVFDAYNEALDAAAEKLIWVDKGAIERNYYVNEFGRSQVNEPWPVQQYYGMIRRPEPSDFVLT